ncbi:MAG: RDD family protein [Terriglobales bacterium]
MNSPETQSDSSSQDSYFDPEAMDTSEQEFSASLEMPSRPGFVVDSQDNLRPTTENEDVGRRASSPSISATDDAAMRSSEAKDPSQIPDEEPSPTDWRDQVSAKVKHYKTLKPREERYPSLQLQFDTVVPWKSDKSPLAAERAEFLASPQTDFPPTTFEPEQSFPYPVSNEATARVLEFPLPGMLPFNRDELADPVIDRPRILEAPELLPPPPALGGMLIEPVRQPEPERQPGVDMPLQTARLSRRVFAGAVDALLVAGATAIFGYMFLRFNSSLPQIRVAAEVAAALTVTLWFAYQAAFLIFCGTTPGLRATHLKISRFDGAPATRSLRRWRLVASALSFVSLGLGYAWSFLDEDQLSWHDRITKTHLAPVR